ncbi:hypothetical protein K0U07_05145 [bacterium]|nr:hypothetical protein [bacterium]
MKKVHLQHLSKDKKLIEAIFAPEDGMNLLSLTKDGQEFIAQDTKEEFERRFAGLGALIGPHFYHRKQESIPAVDEKIFPHIANLDLSKPTDPLSHGIGRYCKWNYSETSTTITGHLSGKDTQNGHTLASLEGFDFELTYSCHVSATGLTITYEVKSEHPETTIGLHYYLALPGGEGFVHMDCKEEYNDLGTWKPIPKEWKNDKGELFFNLKEESDYGFLPRSEKNEGAALLSTPDRKLQVSYKASSEQHAFQLYHPKDASFVCIEPVSAINPRDPKGSNHKLQIRLDIL